MKSNDMTSGNIIKHLILFALPLIAGNIFQQLYNTVDSIVVGNFVGKEALAAVGSTGSIINMLVGFFLGLSTGAGVVVSQHFGAKNNQKLHDAVHTAIMMTFILGIILSILGIMISPTLLRFMKTPADVMPNSTLYLRIYFAGLMGLMVYNMGAGILRAVGDSKRPLYFLIFSSIVNIVLDLTFVVVFKMGIAGVALATVIAQCLSAIVTMYVLYKTTEPYRFIPKDLKISFPELRKIFMIGLPAGLQQAITAFSNIFVQSYVNKFGSSCMAGWASYVKIDQFVLLPVQSIALASTTFIGQNIGAKQIDRVKEGVKKALVLSITVTIVLSIGLNIVGGTLLSIFNSDPDVLKYGMIFLHSFSPFYAIICFNQIYAGAMRGAGDSTAPMVIMLFSFVVFRQLVLFFGTKIFHTVTFVALSFPMGWALCSLLLAFYYHSGRWLKKLNQGA